MEDIRVLLVEDEAPKRAHIENYLRKLSQRMEVQVAKSVSSALFALDAELPDLVLLDMSLPTFDIGDGESGGRPQAFGGIEILRYMNMAQMLCPTIVITGYEAFVKEEGVTVDLSQMRVELANEFPEVLKGVLHYNSTYDEWRTTLASIFENLSLAREIE